MIPYRGNFYRELISSAEILYCFFYIKASIWRCNIFYVMDKNIFNASVCIYKIMYNIYIFLTP